MTADRAGEADALELLAKLLHHEIDLPAVEITVGTGADIRLHVIAREGRGGWQVERWAAALGAPVETTEFTVQAAGRLGAHPVTVWAAA